MSTLPNLKILPFGGAGAVQDADQLQCIRDIKIDLDTTLNDGDIQSKFLHGYQQWIASSKTNTWIGLQEFECAVFANATTEVFDKFYLKHARRRFRCFRGEYMYHILSWRNCFPNWIYIDQAPLHPMDAVVISYPFSDTGGKHAGLDDLLDQCSSMGIPVLLDCAYFGLCQGLTFDLTWPCITDVSFSLSKSFPLANARIGMRLTRRDDDDPLFVINKTNYTNRIGSMIGLHMIENFSADYIPQRYRDLQHQWCQKINAKPSDSVIFGLGDSNWSRYDRGAGNNRLSFHKYLASGSWPNDIT